MLTIDNLLAIYPTLKRDRAMACLPFLTDTLREAQATSKLRTCAFLGQCGQEFGGLRYMTELADG